MENNEKNSKRKQKKVRTPMESARNQIRGAFAGAMVQIVLTLILIVVSVGGVELIAGLDIFALIDVALLVILAILLITLKSRIAAILLLAYYIFSQALTRLETGNFTEGIWMTALFLGVYLGGVLGTFAYHKIKKQEVQGIQTEAVHENQENNGNNENIEG